MPTKPHTHQPAYAKTGDREDKRLARTGARGELHYQVNRMWSSRRWTALRLTKLASDPLCAICEKHGRTTAAREVHHIEPAMHNPSAFFDWDNLLSVCVPCHRAIDNARRARTS